MSQLAYISNSYRNEEAIVMLHGFLGSSADYSLFLSELSKSYYSIAFDLPGHGKSTFLSKEAYLIDNTILILHSQLQDLGVNKIHLIGYSMGGRVALSLANAFPEMIASLTLISSTAGLKTEQERQQRIENDARIIDKIKTMDMTDFLHFWYSQQIFSFSSERINSILSQRLMNNKSEVIKSLRFAGTGMMTPLWDNLQNLNFPILLLSGEKDKKFVRICEEMHKLLPDSRNIVVQNSSHNLLLDTPVETLNLITKFINERQNGNF